MQTLTDAAAVLDRYPVVHDPGNEILAPGPRIDQPVHAMARILRMLALGGEVRSEVVGELSGPFVVLPCSHDEWDRSSIGAQAFALWRGCPYFAPGVPALDGPYNVAGRLAFGLPGLCKPEFGPVLGAWLAGEDRES